MSNNDLCGVCNTLDFDAVRSSHGLDLYAHAKSLRLKATTPDGCRLCSLLWKAMDGGTMDGPRDEDPVRLYASPPPPEECSLFFNTVNELESFPKKVPPDPIPEKPDPMSALLVASASQHVLDKLRWVPGQEWMLASYEHWRTVAKEVAGWNATDFEGHQWCYDFYTQGTLELVIEHGEPIEGQVQYSRVPLNPASDEVFSLVKRWIGSCQCSHPGCHAGPKSSLPTRVIDVGPPDGSHEPCLLVSGQQDPLQIQGEIPTKYICLSYRWGSDPVYTTTISTLEARKQQIPISDLPRTLQDAVQVTRQLGVRYLWVDALCIIQGSENEAIRDWHRESARMGDVYSGAFLTLAAASSSSVHQGIFATRKNQYKIDCSIPYTSLSQPNTSSTLLICEKRPHFADTLKESLHSRGWTLQERHLSKRILYYNSEQISFECRRSIILESESGLRHDGLLQRPYFTKLPGRELDRGVYQISAVKEGLTMSGNELDWTHIVEDYTTRNLSHEQDKLPALSGMAHLYHQSIGDDYLAGLWKSSICDGLLWEHEPTFRYENTVKQSRPSQYRAPSWSWASLDGNVRYHGSLQPQGSDHNASLVDYHITLAGIDPFGQVSDGWISIRGPLKRVCFTGDGNLKPVNHDDREKESKVTTSLDMLRIEEAHNVGHGELAEPWCLLLRGGGAGLILTPTGRKVREFERLGTFFSCSPGWCEGWKEETITII